MKKLKRLVKIASILVITLIVIGWVSITVIDWALSRCDKQQSIESKIADVQKERLIDHVKTLSSIGSRFKRIKPKAGVRVAEADAGSDLQRINSKLSPYGLQLTDGDQRQKKLEYLELELTKYGYQPKRVSHSLKHIPYKTVNLVVEKQASELPDQILDITAHYDTYGSSPGADDNNSGVAGLLEMARLIATQPTVKRTIRFVFFDLEELGLLGSKAWLNSDVTPATANLNLEMIGYYTDDPNTQKTPVRIPLIIDPPREGNFLLIIGNLNSYRISQGLEGAFRTYTPDFPVFSLGKYGSFLADAARSDHSSYWEKNIPAVMVTDSANFRNPHYHQPSDTPDKIDYEKMTVAVKGLTAFAINWANR